MAFGNYSDDRQSRQLCEANRRDHKRKATRAVSVFRANPLIKFSRLIIFPLCLIRRRRQVENFTTEPKGVEPSSLARQASRRPLAYGSQSRVLYKLARMDLNHRPERSERPALPPELRTNGPARRPVEVESTYTGATTLPRTRRCVRPQFSRQASNLRLPI